MIVSVSFVLWSLRIIRITFFCLGLFLFITALKVYKSVLLNIFTELRNHHHHLILEHFHYSIKKLHTHQQSHLLTPGNHPSIFCLYGLACCGHLYKWNQTIYGLCVRLPLHGIILWGFLFKFLFFS